MRPTGKILKAYGVHKSIRKVAGLLGVSYGYVHAVLKANHSLLPFGIRGGKTSRGGRKGPITLWIERHPGVVLPERNGEIAKLIGCSLDDAHSWRVARWYKFKQMVKRVVPGKIIRSWRFGKTEIELVDGKTLGFDELLEIYLQLQKEAKR